jgi:integrase
MAVNERSTIDPRQGSGAVTIRARRGGWQVIVYIGLDPLTGKQRQITRQVNGSKRKAEREEAKLRTEVAEGRHAGTTVKTLGEMVDLWIEWRATNGKPISPHTLDDYRGLIATKIKPALGTKRLVKITPPVLDAYYEQLRKSGNAKAASRARARARAAALAGDDDPAAAAAKPTAAEKRLSANRVRDVHVIITGALGLAARRGWIAFNPAPIARPATGKKAARPTPTPDQLKELFAAVADEPDFATFLRLSAATGLRPGELCALRWVDLDLDAMTVDVNGNIVTAKDLPEKYTRKDPKSGHGERLLALDATSAGLLRAHRARCEQLAQDFETRLAPTSYVFARTPGGALPIRPDAMSKRFTALARRLGHGYTLYGLRHFMATQLGAVAAAGTVRDRMGHGSLAVTSGYMHQVSEADRQAARYMGDLLDGRRAWRLLDASTDANSAPEPS